MMKDYSTPIIGIVVSLFLICALISFNDRKEVKKQSAEVYYPNCSVIYISHYQEGTNFTWVNDIIFVSDGDTINGKMSSAASIKLYSIISSDKHKKVNLVVKDGMVEIKN